MNVVRQPIALKDRSSRSLEERFYLRFPAAAAAGTRAVLRLPPRAWPRRVLLVHGAQLGFAALNRGDFESSFLTYDPELEFVTPPRLVGLGFKPVYRGHQGRIEFQRNWMAEWGEMRFVPDEVVDLGDRFLYLGGVKGSGVSSGAGFESDDWAVLYAVTAGRIVREQPFFDRREALEAAGLPE